MSEISTLPHLNKFLRSGRLGTVHLDLTKQEIAQQLGEPVFYNVEYWDVSKLTMTNMYYDKFLITFLDDEIEQMTLYFRDHLPQTIPDFFSEILEIDWYQTVKELKPRQFRSYLKANDIPFMFLISPVNIQEVIRYWIPQSQVKVTFEEEKIDSMQVLRRLPVGWSLKE